MIDDYTERSNSLEVRSKERNLWPAVVLLESCICFSSSWGNSSSPLLRKSHRDRFLSSIIASGSRSEMLWKRAQDGRHHTDRRIAVAAPHCARRQRLAHHHVWRNYGIFQQQLALLSAEELFLTQGNRIIGWLYKVIAAIRKARSVQVLQI